MSDYGRLLILFRRSSSLPDLPGTAFRLVNAIDSGEASAIELERIISADPGISATVIRLANYSIGNNLRDVTTVRNAILRLGQRSVRSLAMSLVIQDLLKEVHPTIDAQACSRHALLTGLLARYVYARRQKVEAFDSAWSADEIFAAGLVHDVGTVVLSTIAQDEFLRVQNYARRTQTSYEEAFEKIFGESLFELSASAAEAWHLPSLFVQTLRFYSKPWKHQQEMIPLSCLNYADYLATVHGQTTESWPVKRQVPAEVELEVGIPEEEVNQVIPLLVDQVTQYVSERQNAASAA